MKTLLIDAICGGGFLDNPVFAAECEKTGMVNFNRNTFGPPYAWDRRALAAVSEEPLEELYGTLRAKREKDEAEKLTPPPDEKQFSLILQ